MKVLILLILLLAACTDPTPEPTITLIPLPEPTLIPPLATPEPSSTLMPAPTLTASPTKTTISWLPPYVTRVTGTVPTHPVFLTATELKRTPALTFVASTPYPTPTQEIWVMGQIGVGAANLRNAPGFNSVIIGWLYRDERVIYDPNSQIEKDGFTWVRLSNGRQWIALQTLRPTESGALGYSVVVFKER